MGIDAIPRPASGLPARLVLGPALRAQSDQRLVRLVREGYESAFEEIVRRYRRPLDRFAASIVGGRSEDVTQDSFRKALEALRGADAEVELRPWLYRIVRNTALNDLRDRPPAAAELAEDLIGDGRSAATEAEQRETVARLVTRLRALPERQRAALVMRELEGMGHEEIAAALGISGGAARQAIARGRTAVRSGFGALVPLPLLRVLASGDPGVEAAAGGAVGVGGTGAGAAAGGVGATGAGTAASGAAGLGAAGASAAGGALGPGGMGAALFGSGGALKVGLATVVVAGSLGAGVAIDQHGGDHGRRDASTQGVAKAAASRHASPRIGRELPPSPVLADADDEQLRSKDASDDTGERSSGREERRESGDDNGRSRGGDDHRAPAGNDSSRATQSPPSSDDDRGAPRQRSDSPGDDSRSGNESSSHDSRSGNDPGSRGPGSGSGSDGHDSESGDDSGDHRHRSGSGAGGHDSGSGHDSGNSGSRSGRGAGGDDSGSGGDSGSRGSGSGTDSGGSGSRRDDTGSTSVRGGGNSSSGSGSGTTSHSSSGSSGGSGAEQPEATTPEVPVEVPAPGGQGSSDSSGTGTSSGSGSSGGDDSSATIPSPAAAPSTSGSSSGSSSSVESPTDTDDHSGSSGGSKISP